MKTAPDLASDILFALGHHSPCNALVLSIGCKIIAEQILDAELQNGKPVVCPVAGLFLLELHGAFSKQAKKEAKSA
jgi:hypothetical protein